MFKETVKEEQENQKPKKKVLLEWMINKKKTSNKVPVQGSVKGEPHSQSIGLIGKKIKKLEDKLARQIKAKSESSSCEKTLAKKQRLSSQLASVKSHAYFSKVLLKSEKLMKYWKDPSRQKPIIFKFITRPSPGEAGVNLKQEVDLSNRKLMMMDSPPRYEKNREKKSKKEKNSLKKVSEG